MGCSRKISLASAALAAALAFAAPAMAQTDFPALTGSVVDEARILDAATRDTLFKKLADFESGTGNQLVVVTLGSLRNTDIDSYADALAAHWALGSSGKANGALLLLAPKEGKVAIQAGADLRQRLNDAVMGQIINQTLIPRLRGDDVPGGLTRGVDDIIKVLNGGVISSGQQLAQRADDQSQSPAAEFPSLTGRVVDEAGILDAATRSALTQKLADLEAKSSDQLVVVTLSSLRGATIEDYGVRLGRHWQIGQKGKNNGVLLIVAPHERKVRIEVGYGLEGTLTDAIAKVIIENSILPRFKAGDFPGGVRRGTEDIIQVLTGDAEEYKQRAVTPVVRQVTTFEMIVFGIFILVGGFIVFNVIIGGLEIIHAALVALGFAARKPRKGFWYRVDRMATATSSSGSSSGGSSSSDWSSSSSSSDFGGGGGDFGGGGSSGSW
jgi:uncharacterized protein